MAKTGEDTVHEAVVISEVLLKNIPKDFKNDLEDFLQSSSQSEVANFHPVLKAIEDMQAFKELKYKKGDKVSVQAYKDSKKFVGSFNTSITAVKKTLKDPHIEYNRKVDLIYNYFKQESDNVKNALEVNFKEYLDEEAKKKADADAKKKQKELDQIAELTAENQENAAKLLKQKHNTRKLEIEANINSISFDVNTKAPTMNLEGLNQLKTVLNAKRFENYVSEFDIDEFGFTEDEVEFFKQSFNTSVSVCNTTIDTFINALNLTTKNSELETANKVLEAATPASLDTNDNDMPFTPNTAGMGVEAQTQEQPVTDLDKLNFVLAELRSLQEVTQTITASIKSVEFNDESLTKIVAKINDGSMPTINDWSNKLVSWTEGKVKQYQEFLNNNNPVN